MTQRFSDRAVRQPSRLRRTGIPLARIVPICGGRAASGACGFTLVEMLVACAVAMLLLVSLVGIVSQSLTVSRKTNSSLLAYNEAAAAIDLIANDLESLAASAQPFEYLQTAKEDVSQAKGVTRLLMLSVSSQDNTAASEAGHVRAISYRLVRQDPINDGGANNVYGLYRSAVSANATFRDFAGQADLASPFAAVTVSLDDFVAGNIVDFQVLFYPAGNQAPANLVGDAALPVRISGSGARINGSDSPTPLAWAEVTLTVLEENGIKLLDAGSLDMATVKQRYGHLLTRRVALRTPF